MRIFVAGATGVLGRRAVPMLLAEGYEVVATGRDPERRAALERAGATVVTRDLFERAAVGRVLAGHDVVINLATHMPPSAMRAMLPGAFRETDRIRRDGSAILAEEAAACGVGRFIQESFAPIYADGGAEWLDESSPVRPAAYNRTVLAAERSAEAFSGKGGTGVVLRFAGFYGPDAWHLHDMLKMVRRGWAPLPGAASAYWSSVSHDDAASAVVAALRGPSGIYNVCDDEPFTRRAYFDALADAFGSPRPGVLPAWVARFMGSMGELMGRSQRMSNGKLRGYGWAPLYPNVREGFRAVAAEMETSGRGAAIIRER